MTPFCSISYTEQHLTNPHYIEKPAQYGWIIIAVYQQVKFNVLS